ncbi:MAG: proline racemase family protein [Lachnospiraceae bacterium]|nr:proline racemase family protein [Lachnospiraceae bacterium]
MNVGANIRCIDSHTMGEATRIIVGGVPVLKGSTVMEKKKYFLEHYDYIRKMAMLEPRGHADMFGALLTEPCDPSADYGVIFLDGGGCLNMCGHGTIGVCTVLVETGMVKVTEPITEITLEAPAGLVRAQVEVKDGEVVQVSFKNVPAFLYKKDVTVDVPELGRKITCDISFGGSFFAIVKDEEMGVEIDPKNLDDIVPKALALRKALNENVEIKHPYLDITTVDLVEIYGKAKSSDADLQNVVVFGEKQVDRSPCGTGTSAKMADLVARGNLKIGDRFVYESVFQTKFIGVPVEKTTCGDFEAIIPQVTGKAYITGFNDLVLDRRDPLGHGFIM